MPDEHQNEDGYELDRHYLYLQMAGHLARRIATGELVAHQCLPAEARLARLARKYGVSLGTARRATEVLRRHGLVVTVRCKGTFVARAASEEELSLIAEAATSSPPGARESEEGMFTTDSP